MNFYEILMCLVIFASIIGAYWKLKVDMAKIQKDIEQLKMENEMFKENLATHKVDNRNELNIYMCQNAEAHNKIDIKLDKLIDLHLNNK